MQSGGHNCLTSVPQFFQKEEERVVDFKVRVCTYLCALGIDVVRKPEDQKRIIAELRKKFRKTLVEVFEGGGRNILDISWVTLWKELETLESSFFYLQHLKLLKIQAVSQPSSRGDGGGKGKNRGSAAERGKGQGRGRGGGDSGQTIHCFRCGQGGHMANACNNDSGVTGGANTGTHTTNKTQLLEIVRLPVAARKELRTVY